MDDGWLEYTSFLLMYVVQSAGPWARRVLGDWFVCYPSSSCVFSLIVPTARIFDKSNFPPPPPLPSPPSSPQPKGPAEQSAGVNMNRKPVREWSCKLVNIPPQGSVHPCKRPVDPYQPETPHMFLRPGILFSASDGLLSARTAVLRFEQQPIAAMASSFSQAPCRAPEDCCGFLGR